MKTTIELPDRLFRLAKRTALRRRTTLKALMTHALQREVGLNSGDEAAAATFVVDRDGLPHLPARGVRVTNDLVGRLLEEEEA
ncbi:MAG: hypothetical protein BWZ02_02226 [Lentisphaerae bacterium ADurb.BinA184]|nr:MAG: hypothetical protein BWZ02_02226 [Lentisphaerae bacterium ADurb.BinA184]